MTQTVASYIANTLAQAGLSKVFMVTGGGAMHLNEAFGKHPDLQCIFNHHEQASAMAAESYARLTNQPAIVNVTTGPGGINALNGVFGAWTDSIPMVVISGQVRYDTTVASTGKSLRQLGDQEFAEIITCAGTMCKYAVSVSDPASIRHHIEKALFLATHGRPGPVWLDIPMNVQGAQINPDELPGYISQEAKKGGFATLLPGIVSSLLKAERPVILVGAGVRLSRSHRAFLDLLETLSIPVTTAWNAHDVLPDEHPCYAGRPGTLGDRAGNFAVQNADLLLVLGSRLNIRQIGYNWTTFARAAYKIMVDIDPQEIDKPTLKIDLPVEADLADFLPALAQEIRTRGHIEKKGWLDWCITRRHRYPVVLPAYRKAAAPINPYYFVETLSAQLPPGQITVTGDGTACVATFQAATIKPGQRLYTNSGSASMGYDLPAAIGAAIGAPGQDIVCLAGDGSIQMNIQELQTIVHHRMPIKIFILNNDGYHSIRQTQNNYFPPPLVGCTSESGVSFPSFSRLAYAYDIPFFHCDNHQGLESTVQEVLATCGPVMCEIILDPAQGFAPRSASKRLEDGRMASRPLEDLAPFLPDKELAENMLIPILHQNH